MAEVSPGTGPGDSDDGRPRSRAETSAATWERGLGALHAYVTAHGSATPPTHLVVDGFALAR